jgi:predicted RNA-binding protein
MCEANAYLLRDGKEELFLEALDKVEPDNGSLRLTSIYGEQKFVKGRITHVSLVNHRVIIEEVNE